MKLDESSARITFCGFEWKSRRRPLKINVCSPGVRLSLIANLESLLVSESRPLNSAFQLDSTGKQLRLSSGPITIRFSHLAHLTSRIPTPSFRINGLNVVIFALNGKECGKVVEMEKSVCNLSFLILICCLMPCVSKSPGKRRMTCWKSPKILSICDF